MITEDDRYVDPTAGPSVTASVGSQQCLLAIDVMLNTAEADHEIGMKVVCAQIHGVTVIIRLEQISRGSK